MTLDAIVKIGGSILRSPGDYVKAAEAVREYYVDRGARVAVVVSAAKGVTDLLVRAVEGSRRAALEVKERYSAIARDVGGPSLERLVGELLGALDRVRGRAASARAAARILALGEAASRAIMVYALEAVGVKAVGIPAFRVVHSSGHPLRARIDYGRTGESWLSVVKTLTPTGAVPVVEGFVAGGCEGTPAILGRGGSDYTATALAALSTAKTAHLVTDVDGIYTGDPRRIPGSRRVESMGYIEALEAAKYGAKKMHPRTFEPLKVVRPLEVRIGSWRRWTRVAPRPEVRPPGVKLVASRALGSGTVVSLVGSGAASPMILSKAAEALMEAGVDYMTVHSTPSKASLAFTVNQSDEARALEALHSIIEERVAEGAGEA